MALPIAQLGYLPNMSTPSMHSRQVVQDPWQQLAIGILSAAAQKGVGNAMSNDYTSQAQNEGLPVDPAATDKPWYSRMLSGPTTGEGQLEALRGNKSRGDISAASDKAAGTRQDQKITADTTTAIADRTQRSADSIRDINARNAGQATSDARNHDYRMQEQGAQNSAVMERTMAEIQANEKALGRKLTSEEKQTVLKSVIDNVGKMSANNETARQYGVTKTGPEGAINDMMSNLIRLKLISPDVAGAIAPQ